MCPLSSARRLLPTTLPPTSPTPTNVRNITAKSLRAFFFSSRRRHTRCLSVWSSDVCSSDLLQIGDNFAQLACRTLTLVVDQVGVILGHANPAVSDSLGAHLLQKICGRHLAFPDYTLRHLPLHRFRKLREDQILKDAAGALHSGGGFFKGGLGGRPVWEEGRC